MKFYLFALLNFSMLISSALASDLVSEYVSVDSTHPYIEENLNSIFERTNFDYRKWVDENLSQLLAKGTPFVHYQYWKLLPHLHGDRVFYVSDIFTEKRTDFLIDAEKNSASIISSANYIDEEWLNSTIELHKIIRDSDYVLPGYSSGYHIYAIYSFDGENVIKTYSSDIWMLPRIRPVEQRTTAYAYIYLLINLCEASESFAKKYTAYIEKLGLDRMIFEQTYKTEQKSEPTDERVDMFEEFSKEE